MILLEIDPLGLRKGQTERKKLPYIRSSINRLTIASQHEIQVRPICDY